MTLHVTPRRRGSYGIDAPYGPAFMAVVAAFELALAVSFGNVRNLLAGLFILAILGIYLHGTLRGKFVVWAKLLETLNLRGDERILDMGCGRGAVLLMAAQHLTTGRAVGVDLWRNADQSGNSTEATQRNAVAEGVADRVELHTGDMTALPFEDNGVVVGIEQIVEGVRSMVEFVLTFRSRNGHTPNQVNGIGFNGEPLPELRIRFNDRRHEENCVQWATPEKRCWWISVGNRMAPVEPRAVVVREVAKVAQEFGVFLFVVGRIENKLDPATLAAQLRRRIHGYIAYATRYECIKITHSARGTTIHVDVGYKWKEFVVNAIRLAEKLTVDTFPLLDMRKS